MRDTSLIGNLAYPQSLESAPSALQLLGLPASLLWVPQGSLPLLSPAPLSPGNTSPMSRAGGLCKICSLTVPCRARPPGRHLGFQSCCFSLGLQWWLRDQCWTPYPGRSCRTSLGMGLGRDPLGACAHHFLWCSHEPGHTAPHSSACTSQLWPLLSTAHSQMHSRSPQLTL